MKLAEDRQRTSLRAKRLLGQVNKDDAQDRYDFMEQCISDLSDSGADTDEAEQICQMLWDEIVGD